MHTLPPRLLFECRISDLRRCLSCRYIARILDCLISTKVILPSNQISGTYSGFSDVGCVNCPAGYYSDDASESCDQCPRATYAPTEGTPVCLTCPAGYAPLTSGSGNTACYICPEGRVANGGYVCYSCWYGSYSAGLGSTGCSNCALGKYQDARTQTSCKNCPVGTYSYQVATRYCIACEYGRFAAVIASPECTNCTAGQYSISVGILLYVILPSRV